MTASKPVVSFIRSPTSRMARHGIASVILAAAEVFGARSRQASAPAAKAVAHLTGPLARLDDEIRLAALFIGQVPFLCPPQCI